MSLQKIEAASEDASIDTIIRQTIGREPYLSFSRASGSPVQWSQLAYLPGWPLLYPMKIQTQKCEKCSREFCSTISYRRHLRLHRRKLNLDKDSAAKSRGLLQAFWDKLSVEEAIEIMSVDDISLEGVSGSSIVKALISVIQKPGYTSLPQTYVKPGSVLLDIVQGRRSRYPISSQELFDILDDASENTFLCAGTAESLQKFVFDGDAGKIGLEMRNLVVCTSFLVEQKLVKACLADKDAESLRYQKLLVDEEEAAQKRQAALLEKKRLKKLRQKEPRAKELTNAESDVSPEESSPSPTSSSPGDDYDSTTIEMLEISRDESATPEDPQLVNVEDYIVDDQENRQPELGAHQMGHEDPQLVNVEEDIVEDQENKQPELGARQMGHKELGAYQNLEHRRLHRSGQRQVVNSRWQAPKSHKYPNGFHNSQKHGSSRNSHTATNGTKVWTVKPKSEIDEVSSKPRLLVEAPKPPSREIELLIGSIPVSLGNRSIQVHDGNPGGVSENCTVDVSIPGENGTYEKPGLGDENQVTAECSADMKPVSVNQHDNGGHIAFYNSSGASNESIVIRTDSDVVHSTRVDESSFNEYEESDDKSDSCVEGGHQEGLKFSSHLAEAFLSQRWKEAITADHVELVLFPEETPCSSVAQEDR